MRATSPSLFLGTRSGLYRWQDGVVAPISGGSDPIATLLPLPFGRLLVGTEGSRVLGFGEHGREAPSAGPLSSDPIASLLLLPGSRRVLAATRGRGLFVSDDLGESFRARPPVGEEGTRLELLSVPGRPQSVLAFTDDGVWHSPDAGESFARWSEPASAALFPGLRCAVVHPDDHRLWLVAARGGLLRSLDGARTFRPVDALAPGTRACALVFERSAPHRLFLLAESAALPPEPAGPSPLGWSDDAGRSFTFVSSRRLDRARDPSGEITSLAIWRDHDRTLAGLGTDRGELLFWRGGDSEAECIADAFPPIATLAPVAAARALDPSTSGIYLLP
jgi:photosystem II stability/assembly factor-like uncharacterized protein